MEFISHADPNEILQDFISEHLEIFRMCLASNYAPLNLRNTRVVFKPKAIKINHSKANNYRPINLFSFHMKVLERIHICGLFNPEISDRQHVYMNGKSTITVLHDLVRTIESSLSIIIKS